MDEGRDVYDCEACEDDPPPDLVIDVRPAEAREKNPLPRSVVEGCTVIELFADEVLSPENLACLTAGYPPGAVRICCVCWSGARAVRVAYHLRSRGWDASWWALSPIARAARAEEAA